MGGPVLNVGTIIIFSRGSASLTSSVAQSILTAIFARNVTSITC
jgi:hypothetical protein